MPGLFQRIKVWKPMETVAQVDLNREFDNIITNLIPSKIDDYSANLAQMQEMLATGSEGSEVLATNLSEELKQLRYMVREITGGTQWYTPPENTLSGLNSILSAVSFFSSHRIVSGRIDANNQPMFLVPHGAARTVTLKAGAANPNFVASITGALRTFSADLASTNLTLAPAANNTCLVNDAALTGDLQASTTLGEFGTVIPIDTIGSSVSALQGQYAAFKIVDGANTEYFVAEVDTTNSRLKNVSRGYFFDSSDTAKGRIPINNNATITLLKLTYVFATYNSDTAGIDVVYTQPIVSAEEPSSPASGDYWFDMVNDTWKKYSSSYAAVDAILIGVCAQDTTNTIVARSFDFQNGFADLNTVFLERPTVSTLRSRDRNSKLNVYGSFLNFNPSHLTWDMTTDLDAGETEASSTIYYFYVTELGKTVISKFAPHDRRADLFGFYHTSKPWRCVGESSNSSGSDLGTPRRYGLLRMDEVFDRVDGAAGVAAVQPAWPGAIVASNALNFLGAATTFTDVTLGTISVRSSGKPIRVCLEPSGSAGSLAGLVAYDAANRMAWQIELLRDGVVIATFSLPSETGTVLTASNWLPPGVIDFIDRGITPGALHVYKLQYKTSGAGTVAIIARMIGYEWIG